MSAPEWISPKELAEWIRQVEDEDGKGKLATPRPTSPEQLENEPKEGDDPSRKEGPTP